MRNGLRAGFKANKNKNKKNKSIDKMEGGDQRIRSGREKNRGYNHESWSLCIL